MRPRRTPEAFGGHRAGNRSSEQRPWRRQIRLHGARGGAIWNLPGFALYEHAVANHEGSIVEGGAFCAETGIHTGRSPKDKFVVCDESTEKTIWWAKNGKLTPAQFDLLHEDFLAPRQGQGALRPGPLWRRRREVSHQGAGVHRACLALAVHPHPADPARSLRACALRSRFHHLLPALVQGRSTTSRRALADCDRDQFQQAHDSDRRLLLRRRDEEVSVHDAQLLLAGGKRDADALLGERRQGRRCCAVLRPFRHRQDHAVGRSQPHADRR